MVTSYIGAVKAWDDQEACKVQSDLWAEDKNKLAVERSVALLLQSYGADSVLDLGCGCGRFALACTYKRYLGIDQSLNMVELAQMNTRKIAGCKFLNEDVLNYSLTAWFDIAILIHVLQHTTDPELFIKRVLDNYGATRWIFTILVNDGHEPIALNIGDEIAARALTRKQARDLAHKFFIVTYTQELLGVGVEDVKEILYVGKPR